MLAEFSAPFYGVVTFLIVALLGILFWLTFGRHIRWALEPKTASAQPPTFPVMRIVLFGVALIVGMWFIGQGFSVVGPRTETTGGDHGVGQHLREVDAVPTTVSATLTPVPVDARGQDNADQNQAAKDRFTELGEAGDTD